MSYIAGLALVLLTLVGYSSGAVLGAKGRRATPGIVDIAAVATTWIVVLATRTALGRWSAIGIWLLVGLFLGGVLTLVRANSYPKTQQGMMGSGLWNAVKAFARDVGNYHTRVLMAFVYFVLVLPFGLGVTLLGDPLKIRRGYSHFNWQPKELSIKPSLDEARRQF